MELTQKEIDELRALKKLPDSDNIKIKEKIKLKLLENRKLIFVINNKEYLEEDVDISEYYGINILPYYLIHPTQHKSDNFICYTVGYRELLKYNKSMKLMRIIFVVLCEQKNIIDKTTGIARHDLLAHLLVDQFNMSNIFGNYIQLVSDEESVVDSDYACRTLIFEQTVDNNLVKTRNGVSGFTNIDVIR